MASSSSSWAATSSAASAAAGVGAGVAGATDAALQLGTAAAWEEVAERADEAAELFCRWRDDPEWTELDLGMLGLRRLPDGFWEHARGVEELQLYNNKLAELPAEMGRLGASLRMLNLAGNQELKTLPGATLAHLTVLQSLSLSGNGLASLPDELFAMASLRMLNLTDCKALMKAGPAKGPFPRIWQLTNLTWLNISDNCGLRGELDVAVGNLVNLQHLNLSYNPELTGIPEEALGQLVYLKRLSFYDCESLVALPASIGRLTRLQELQCGGSGLKTLPPQIGDCIALKELQLNLCQSLTHLPPSLSRCTALEELDLEDTPALQSPPPEVVARSKWDDFAPVLDYLRGLDAGRLTKSAAGAAAAGADGAAGH